MKYRLKDMKIFTTPKAEKMFEFRGLSEISFEFPGVVKTILFIQCGQVRGSLRGGKDYYEIVGRLYESDNPQETGENHVGKIYIYVHDHPHATRFETSVERFEWYPDGSFDVILPDGQRIRRKPPSSQ